ncbi:hypothetical protein GCM10010172_51030 [Paractinoplanes ferrugineus]|uniref:Uncharacterized protein n=1 Tax=Paractinoplanes ferrugineus TaxID=113564 RepID=A0A919J9M3_9ACTN|nr:hypothetical protein [Actinoplanes ferrugineus]GIE16079.1 hypothetical protein Afe05nite_79190 [Actinoplanes ferrugineus]
MVETEPFEAWELKARIALGDQGMGYHAANPIIADVRAHCEYTGESPYEAFGDPREFAATTAADQPPELLEKVGRDGLTAIDQLTGELFVLSLAAVVLPLFFAVKEKTWSFPATAAALTGTALLVLALFAVGSGPRALRAAGRPGLTKFSYLAAGLLGAGAVAAFAGLPHEHLFPVPALAIVALALVGLYLLTRGPKKPAESAPHVPPTPRTARPVGAEAWLTRLTGLLIGRYDLAPERAVELAREAGTHLADSGRTPQEEFGPVEDYALEVSRHEPVRKEPFHRTRPARLLGAVLGVLICGGAFLGWLDGGPSWAAWSVALPATVGALWMLVRSIR